MLEGALYSALRLCRDLYTSAFLRRSDKEVPPKVRLSVCIILVTAIAADFLYSREHPNKGEGITDYIALPCSQLYTDHIPADVFQYIDIT